MQHLHFSVPSYRSFGSLLAGLLVCVALFAPVASMAQPVSGPTWAQLSPTQQQALAPLRHDWDTLDAPRKQKWLEVASRFGNMTPAEKDRIRERMTEWARLSPTQRSEARINYQQSKQVPAQDRQARWEAYQALSPDERAALAARAAKPAANRSAPSSPAQALRGAPVDAQAPKSNIVTSSRGAAPPNPVAPTVVQGNPGATTRLVTATPTPPAHQHTGQPKIAATPKLVDKATLLPKSGPQAAGAAGTKTARLSSPPSAAAMSASGSAPAASSPQ